MTGIIDAHHHVWRQADLPWLMGPMQPRIFGPYEAIRRDYPIADYLADIEGSGVTRSVYVQANWAPERAFDEAAWVQETADADGWPHAIVAYADFTGSDVRPQLDRLARLPLVRGLRQQLHWHENPTYRFASRSDLAADPVVQLNIGQLADYGFAFELQVFAPQMADAAKLAPLGALLRVEIGLAFWHMPPEEFQRLTRDLPTGAGSEAIKEAIEANAMHVWHGPSPRMSRDTSA